jgi:ubiquinone/menaquinone biosynthesis C-methylase UbiE
VELLDGDLDPATLGGNLRDLARVNHWLGGSDLSWGALRPHLSPTEEISVLDVGTGAADIPIALLERAHKSGLGLRVVATDVRTEIVALGGEEAARHVGLVVRLGSADRIDEGDASFDVVHASLVMHHLEPAAAIGLLREMGRVARQAVIVNDLDRGLVWWLGAWLLAHVATRNRYTRHDAPLSVRRAYTPDEVTEMARVVGLRETARYRALPGYRYALAFEVGSGPHA